VKREGQERDEDDDDDSNDSTDEDFNPEGPESDVVEEYVYFGILLNYLKFKYIKFVTGLIVTHHLQNQNLIMRKKVKVMVKKIKRKRRRIKNQKPLKLL